MIPVGFVIELLVTGMLGIIWVLFFIFAAGGTEWLDFQIIKEWTFWIPLLALVYAFGVVIDNFVGRIMRAWTYIKLAEYYFADLEVPYGTEDASRILGIHGRAKYRWCIYSLYAHLPSIRPRLNYIRARIRITRASSFNFLLIGVSGSAFVFIRYGSRWLIGVVALATGILLSVLSFFTHKRIATAWYRAVRCSYEILLEKKA